jgi:hypothetical protein
LAAADVQVWQPTDWQGSHLVEELRKYPPSQEVQEDAEEQRVQPGMGEAQEEQTSPLR